MSMGIAPVASPKNSSQIFHQNLKKNMEVRMSSNLVAYLVMKFVINVSFTVYDQTILPTSSNYLDAKKHAPAAFLIYRVVRTGLPGSKAKREC